MKKFLLRVLFFLVPFLWWVYVSAQPKKEKDCSATCFLSEVVSVDRLPSGCTSYEMKVSFSGKCAHALSHFTVAVPCGRIEDIWNSEGWSQEIGKDPTTALQGFKIDNIAGFGEGSVSSFTVKFTVCPTGEECGAQLACWQPLVAYKASTCVNYQTLAVNCATLNASIEKSDVSCFGEGDGSMSVVVADGQEPFTFLWSDGSTDQSRSNLPAGEYSVTIRDASGSELTFEESIDQPEKLSVSGALSAASCNGSADGAIDLTVSGGSGGHTIAWSNGANTEDLANLLSGKYTVTVSDESGCTATADFLVGHNATFNITSTNVPPDCNAANGSIDLGITGTSSSYSFEWSTGATTEDIAGISAGLYKVKVTDDAGCSQEKSFIIHDNNTLHVTGSGSAASCTEASGEIHIEVSGGTEPYEFSWSTGETTQDLTGLTSGFYTVTVKDKNTCTATAGFTVAKKTFQVPKIVVQPACHGDNNGSITLQEPEGGTAPYTYEWSTGHTGTSLENIGAGTYQVTITDATTCSRTISTIISDPPELAASTQVSSTGCNADGTFDVDASVSGGTAPYTYSWSDGSTEQDRTALSEGVLTLVVIDSKGCTVSTDVTVEGDSPAWSCLITELASQPVCSSAGNSMSTPVTDADSYSWTVTSADEGWTISSGMTTSSITFVAGTENSSATFSLSITKDGCSMSCSYQVTACAVDDNSGEEPGGEEPGGEEPGEEPGGENPDDNGSQTCEECFTTRATLIEVSGNCRTYEMEVATNGLCRHDLSHWTLAIPCGTLSNYSNSRGWKMQYGQDPTTGLYGLKVDDISSFGKEEGSFTLRFTLCDGGNCDLSFWDPTVAYKAGQCVAVQNIEVSPMSSEGGRMSVYPNPFTDQVHFEWHEQQEYVSLDIIDQYGNIVSRSSKVVQQSDGYSIILESASLPKGMYYYRMNMDGQLLTGKISKR